jgi:PAS domain S-box-containing protein
VGRHYSAFYSPEDVAAGVPSRQLEIAAAEGRIEVSGWRMRKDGTRFWADVVITALFDEGGVLCGFGKVTRDMTSWRELEDGRASAVAELERRVEQLASAREQLRGNEARYRLLFEQTPLPLVAYDRFTLEILYASEAMVSRYGYTLEELLGMVITDLVPAEDVAQLLAYIAVTPRGSRPEFAASIPGYPKRHRLKDGAVIEIAVTSANIDLNGRACRVAHFEDATERNRMAAELQDARDAAVEASNVKSAFLANMSHEIRTPMSGVIGMTDLLLEMTLDDEARQCAEQIARSADQALSVINDILDLSKIETGHLELELPARFCARPPRCPLRVGSRRSARTPPGCGSGVDAWWQGVGRRFRSQCRVSAALSAAPGSCVRSAGRSRDSRARERSGRARRRASAAREVAASETRLRR